ncbi:MAG: transcriptional regulator, partial [Lachnospiraceae bacterium]|nr:transcriptional regulator [Lachnospiraceae bacterium]
TREILTQYKRVRQFALEMQIPYSTLVTALERGIEGMAYGTVIAICEKLGLNPVNFQPLDDASVSEKILESRVMQDYLKMNNEGREKFLELMEDFASIKKYRK